MSKTIEVALGGTFKLSMREVYQPGAFVTLTLGAFTVKARGDDMAYTLPVDMQVDVVVSYVDSDGNPANVDGGVTWATSDPQIAAVVATPGNSFEAVVRPGGQLGQAQITATADADLGDGVRELITMMDVEVVAGEAVAGTITPAGGPTPIPEVQPVADRGR
jgi:hypothetical protein